MTFEDLRQRQCPPLKIVATDLGVREPRVFSAAGGDELNGSVIDAVRASMSYPFVFCPVKMNNRYYVDGGLSSNLPVFLFERERAENRLPVVAFDLVAPFSTTAGGYTLRNFLGDLMSTALESGDFLMRRVLDEVYHVRIPIPEGIGTLDFALTRQRREELFDRGHSVAHTFFRGIAPNWTKSGNVVERLQEMHAPEHFVAPILSAIITEVESNTKAEKVRANIMLPTNYGTRVVTYHCRMVGDSDSDLELDLDGGCSGEAWACGKATWGDLSDSGADYRQRWKMTREQQSKVKPDRRAIFSTPIFEPRPYHRQPTSGDPLHPLGTLSIDSATLLHSTGWASDRREYLISTMDKWAGILSRILRR